MEDKLKPEEKKDLMDMVTPDMAKAMDMLAWQFLSELNYDIEDCKRKGKKGEAGAKRLGKKLDEEGLELIYHLPTADNSIYFYYTLNRKGTDEVVHRSRSIEFRCKVVNIGGMKGSE